MAFITDSLMDAAGRSPSQPFEDFRSASLAKRLTKKYPRKPRSRKAKGYFCEFCNPPRNRGRLMRRTEADWAVKGTNWTGEWADQLHTERDFVEELNHMDLVVRYQRFGKDREYIERIARRGPATPDTDIDKPEPQNKLLSSHLVANLRADVSLHTPIRPSQGFIQVFARMLSGVEPLRQEDTWYGSYAFQWHRNASGCWEMGYAGECGACAFSCSCCCTGNGSMYWPCSCEEFGVGTSCEAVAPEERQQCSLVEWAGGELWRIMLEDEKKNLVEVVEQVVDVDGIHYWSDGWQSEEDEWEVLCMTASDDGWSVVSADDDQGSEFEMLQW